MSVPSERIKNKEDALEALNKAKRALLTLKDQVISLPSPVEVNKLLNEINGRLISIEQDILDCEEILHNDRLAKIEFHAPPTDMESQLLEAFETLSAAVKSAQDAREVMKAATDIVSMVGRYAKFNLNRSTAA